MKEEPFFLVNEFLEKERRDLENVITLVQNSNTKTLERAAFLRNFTNAIFNAYRKTKKTPQLEKENLKKELIEKRKELLVKLDQLQTKPEPLKESKELILSKETKKPLVKTEFDGTKYLVIEPLLTEQDNALLSEIKKTGFDEQKLIGQIKLLTNRLNINYSEEYSDKIRYYIIRDTRKFGRISPLIEDKEINEIICSGADKPITITYRGKHDIATNIVFDSDEQINTFVNNVATKVKQDVTQEKPFLNTTLENLTINANIGTDFLKPKFVIAKER